MIPALDLVTLETLRLLLGLWSNALKVHQRAGVDAQVVHDLGEKREKVGLTEKKERILCYF